MVSASAKVPAASPVVPQPRRERLPDTRHSMTHKFDIQGHEGYLTVGFYEDGRPGEVFVTMAKEGSTVGGLMDVVGTLVSMGLQYGVPLDVFVNKFAHSRFEPSGFTRNPDIPIAKSITDYIFRWLGIQFVPGYREANVPNRETPTEPKAIEHVHDDAPAAPVSRSTATARRPPPTWSTWSRRRPPRHALDPGSPREPARAVRPLPVRRPRLRQLRRPDRPLRHLLPLLQLRQQHGVLVTPVHGGMNDAGPPRGLNPRGESR